MNDSLPPRPDRRTAMKWMLAAAASTTLIGRASGQPAPVAATGYGTDPNLTKSYKPGDFWPLTFTDAQRATAAALCGIIIPADDRSPSATELHVHDFIDEWISAPYPDQAADRPVILDGLAWIETEAKSRFGKDFGKLAAQEYSAICDDICFVPKAVPPFGAAAKFFARFRDLTAGGFYTTPQGSKDIGYTGNVPQVVFAGPTPEVLQKLGLS